MHSDAPKKFSWHRYTLVKSSSLITTFSQSREIFFQPRPSGSPGVFGRQQTIYLPWAARFLRYSSKDSPAPMAPFLPRELFSAVTGVGSLV